MGEDFHLHLNLTQHCRAQAAALPRDVGAGGRSFGRGFVRTIIAQLSRAAQEPTKLGCTKIMWCMEAFAIAALAVLVAGLEVVQLWIPTRYADK
jgi:hypothetical protein